MFKVLLADDEPLILKGLKKIIDWKKYNMEIIGEAGNGKALWELTKQLKPDIVITDIQMPHASGIDYMKRLRVHKLDIKVLLISAYEEFSYAKDALTYSATGYLIKPLSREQLIGEIQKISQLLYEERNQTTQKSELATYKKKSEKDQVIDWFYEIFEGSINDHDEHIIELESRFTMPLFAVLLISIDRSQSNGLANWEKSENQLLYFALQNLIEECLTEEVEGILINRQEDNFCVVVNHEGDQQAIKIAEKIVNRSDELLKIHTYIGIGNSDSLDELRTSFNLARKRSEYYFFSAPERIISEIDFKQPKPEITAKSLTEQRDYLFYSIISEGNVDVKKKLDQFFDWLFTISDERSVITISACFSIISELLDELRQLGIHSKLGKGNQKILNDLHELTTFMQLTEYITLIIQDLADQLTLSSHTKENFQIKVVKDYIEEHYDEDITLESMAILIHMNSYYFSSFFKKHTKTNFKKYLTDIRMKEALRLLMNEDLLIYEVAEKVGYNNVRQFSDMFKKYYKKLPSEYKS